MTTTRSTDTRLPLWLRVVALAVEHATPDVLGTLTATFAPGELRDALSVGGVAARADEVSRALRVAEQHGMIADGASTRCVRLIPGSLTVPLEEER